MLFLLLGSVVYDFVAGNFEFGFCCWEFRVYVCGVSFLLLAVACNGFVAESFVCFFVAYSFR